MPRYAIHYHGKSSQKEKEVVKIQPKLARTRGVVVRFLAHMQNDEFFSLDKITYGAKDISNEHQQLFEDYAKHLVKCRARKRG